MASPDSDGFGIEGRTRVDSGGFLDPKYGSHQPRFCDGEFGIQGAGIHPHQNPTLDRIAPNRIEPSRPWVDLTTLGFSARTLKLKL